MYADDTVARLIQACVKARENSYSPYSRFRVGAAVLCYEDDSIVTGCNVENCSYGLTLCAEQVAIANAVSNGHKRFKAIAVSTDAESPITPCGRCRQFIMEFDDMDVYLVNNDGSISKKFTLEQLLPLAFSPRDIH